MGDVLGPPINRSMRQLDRAFFRKTIPLSAAAIYDNRNISMIRQQLSRSHDVLSRGLCKAVVDDPSVKNRKCIVLRPEVVDSSELDLCIH